MRLYNTLSGAVEQFEPLQPGRVGIYVCGVTPYDQSHIGHAMSAIVYDVLVRYLRWEGNPAGGYEVTYVSNYTDVDDKVIERAHELGRDPLALAAGNIEQWDREQAALNLLPPNERPRVTGEIETIVSLIERIIENGHGYATPQGNVYFRVRSKADYGKLSHRNVDQLLTGTRFEPGEDKEFPLDFALWKAAKPGEPKWKSPWGEGRPGWHIECSAMSQRYLGDTFDIHAGGMDLVFPHHENEIAQSEAATGRPFARLWMHNGMVLRDGEKMSKSLSNVVTVEEALSRWSADAIRLFVLNSHYRSPNNITDEAMQAAERGVRRLTNALQPPREGQQPGLDPGPLRAKFVDAMENDLNTPQALAALFGLARSVNAARDAGQDLREARATLRELSDVLGLTLNLIDLITGTVAATLPSLSSSTSGTVTTAFDTATLANLAARFDVRCDREDAGSIAQAIVERRAAARAERDYETADAIREALGEVGLVIEDTPDGTRIVARR